MELRLVEKHQCIQEGRLGTLEEHDKNTDRWQEKQNGSLLKLADKIDRLQWAIIALLLGVVADLAMRFLP